MAAFQVAYDAVNGPHGGSLVQRRVTVKGKHPEMIDASARCSTCGSVFTIRSTVREMVTDVCSQCHPAYTGSERKAAGGSRIERFERRRALAA